MPDDPRIPVKLARVVLRDGADQQWIFLQEVEGARGFPIVIGSQEAAEIHRVLGDQRLPRPLTHQLALSAIEALGSRLVGVDIVDLRNNTFYAALRLAPVGEGEGGRVIEVDARPSDALALALRAGAPLRVAESVLEQARTDDAPDALPPPLAPGSGDALDEDDDGPGPDEPGADDSDA